MSNVKEKDLQLTRRRRKKLLFILNFVNVLKVIYELKKKLT